MFRTHYGPVTFTIAFVDVPPPAGAEQTAITVLFGPFLAVAVLWRAQEIVPGERSDIMYIPLLGPTSVIVPFTLLLAPKRRLHGTGTLHLGKKPAS
jgi:hypothetical protein